MDFELTEGQKAAMTMAEKLMKARPPMPAVITGFAGTGKTTMLKAIASRFGAPTVLAPTGKAALRVEEATGLEAGTIHRWLYQPKENQQTGEIEFKKKEKDMVSRPANGLLVIDEASMVGRDLWEDLWDMCQLLELKVLLVGDTFQLQPVETKRDDDQLPYSPLLDVDTQYRVHLDEITRQALDNPILRASMLIRESSRLDQALPLLNRVFTKNFDDKALEIHRQGGAVIVHKNDTRHRINSMIRERLGYSSELQKGEPLLVLRNNYEIDRFNGEIIPYQGWSVYNRDPEKVEDRWRSVTKMLTFGLAHVDGHEVMLVPEQVRGEAAIMTESVIAKASRRFFGNHYAPDNFIAYDPTTREYLGPPHLHANFGYALTAHKSQGSEWDQVLVLIEPSVRASAIDGRRWIYTAITRARKSCYFAMGA